MGIVVIGESGVLPKSYTFREFVGRHSTQSSLFGLKCDDEKQSSFISEFPTDCGKHSDDETPSCGSFESAWKTRVQSNWNFNGCWSKKQDGVDTRAKELR